jgi:catechol 2,3-dioxygenase-like lactoylglutathione lyase family enzyme
MRVDHVWFWVAHMERSIAFYRDLLGLALVRRAGNEWAELDGGLVRLALHGATADRARPQGGTVVFPVDDLDAARLRLEGLGVTFDEHVGEVPEVGRFASFADPDGNRLQLFEYDR